MSAERHALEAALEYSKKLEHDIKCLEDEVREQRDRNNELRRQVNNVKDAVSERDRPCDPSYHSDRPMCESAMGPQTCDQATASRPRCKNCGCPV